MIILNRFKKTMTPNTRINTANTGLSASKKQLNVPLNVEIISKRITRIKCTNTHCKHEYFRPFVASLKGACKSWHLFPSLK